MNNAYSIVANRMASVASLGATFLSVATGIYDMIERLAYRLVGLATRLYVALDAKHKNGNGRHGKCTQADIALDDNNRNRDNNGNTTIDNRNNNDNGYRLDAASDNNRIFHRQAVSVNEYR